MTSRNGTQRAGITNDLRRKSKIATNFVLDLQARRALDALRSTDGLMDPTDPDGIRLNPRADPKEILLDTVQSAWRQRQVWEALLASAADDDFDMIGTPPIPGLRSTSRGARIEIIQHLLTEATKTAARTSKLAIDAGIEERLVHLAEEQAQLIADTVRAGLLVGLAQVFRLLGLPQPEADRITDAALQASSRHLKALAAGGTEVIEGVAAIAGPIMGPRPDPVTGEMPPRPAPRMGERRKRPEPESKP